MVAVYGPDVYEAFDVEFIEREQISAELAAEAAAEAEAAGEWVPSYSPAELDTLIEDLREFIGRVDTLPADFALTNAEMGPEWEADLEAGAAERAYWQRQAARESFGDFIAQQAAELETDEEPTGYLDPSDESLCGVR